MSDWTTAQAVPALAHLLTARLQDAPPPRPAPLPTDAFLIFDPTRPKVLGLILLYGILMAPIFFLLTSCIDVTILGAQTKPLDNVGVFNWLIGTPLWFFATVGLFVGSLLLRNRHRLGLPITTSALAVSTFGGLLFFGVGILIAVASSESPDAEVVQQGVDLSTVLDLISSFVAIGLWFFDWFCIIWLWRNWRRLQGS
jgi:hypothetical protein